MIFDAEGTIRARATLGADDYKIAWQATWRSTIRRFQRNPDPGKADSSD